MPIKSRTITHRENPFIENFELSLASKSVKISPIGKGSNVLINTHTGEVHGTHVSTYRKVDDAEFVKIFTANIALTFDLKTSGIKAFNVLLFAVQKSAIERDLIQIDEYTLEKFLANNTDKKLSYSTLKRGLLELIEAKIIAKHTSRSMYFINPNFVFNGNRVTFSTTIDRT
jgi:hypothetical protein